MSNTTDALDATWRAIRACYDGAPAFRPDVVQAALETLVARAREEGAREAASTYEESYGFAKYQALKNRLIATQMTLGNLWALVDQSVAPPELTKVVKLALEPAP